MKKLFPVLASACILFACGEASTSGDDSATTDTSTSSSTTPTDTITTAGAVKDGVMQMKDGKVVIMRNGSWEPITADVTTTNGRKVSPDGNVTKGDRKRKLEEGMMIDQDGQLMDKDGKMLDNTGWE